MKSSIRIVLILLLLFFVALMLEITLPYFSLEPDEAFLRIKQWVFRNNPKWLSSIWITAFYIHVFTSTFALIAGFTQFSSRFLWQKTHRMMGGLYIIIILLLTGPSGLIMAFFANGGLSSQAAFSILALLWWWFTFKAYTAIRRKDYEEHGKYMYRSYALTLSAITLRLWKYIIVNYLYELPPMDLYRLVAWLGWVPNLIFAEILIDKGKHLNLLRKKMKPKKEG